MKSNKNNNSDILKKMQEELPMEILEKISGGKEPNVDHIDFNCCGCGKQLTIYPWSVSMTCKYCGTTISLESTEYDFTYTFFGYHS